jgi:NADPH:quinone reductase-like Zn-dependent oxidoreductase
MTTGKMKAAVYNKKGTPEKLIYTTVNKPVPNDNQLVIKVVASSINAADYRSIRMGFGPKHGIFGADIAGVVESVGKKIIKFKSGDLVVGELTECGFGGWAEFAVAPENAVVKKPTPLSFDSAAALPLAGGTALLALRKGGLKKGQNVLIAGSGGGVGTYAVQLAKYYGARITAVCGTDNVDLMKSLGADNVIDYTTDDFTKNNESYDVILAINGNRPLGSYMKQLSSKGKCIVVGGALSQIFKTLFFGWLFSFGSKKISALAEKLNQSDLELLVKLAADGTLRPIIDKKYTLSQTADALRYVYNGHVRGKVVISVE